MLYAPAFQYTDAVTTLLLGIGLYAIALYMLACLATVAAFAPSVRIGAPWLIAIATLAVVLNPTIWAADGTDASYIFSSYVTGIVPYGFPFGIVGAWSLVAAVRAARSHGWKALAYGAVPLLIVIAYCAGFPLADRLVVATAGTVRPAFALPTGSPQIIAYQLDAGNIVCDCQRFVVRDDAHIGMARAAELIRRTAGPRCETGAGREILAGWYDISRDCNDFTP